MGGSVINGPPVRGCHTCINCSRFDIEIIQIATVFSSLFFRSLSHGGSLTLYIPPWIILILHLLIIWAFTWVSIPSDSLSGFSVSCDSQGNTVQGSCQHKCDQESSCSAFNAVVTAFSKIFLRFHHPWTFMIHILITGASWKVIMIVRTCIWYVFLVSEEIFILRPSSHLYFPHWVLGLNHSLPFTRPRTAQFLVKAQGPTCDLGP